jgi:hypothetical protein
MRQTASKNQPRFNCFDAIFQWVFHHHPHHWLLMLEAYIDDTSDKQGRFAGFGGFAARRESWSSLMVKWRELNESHNLKEFHAADNALLVPEYTQAVLDQKDIWIAGGTIDLPTYRSFTPRRRVRESFGSNEWAAAASTCVDSIIEWLRFRPQESCALVVDCMSRYKTTIQEAIDDVKQQRSENGQQLFPVIIVTEKDKDRRLTYPMLQVADLGANLACKSTCVTHYSDGGSDPLWPFMQQRKMLVIPHWDKGSLEKAADVRTDPNPTTLF